MESHPGPPTDRDLVEAGAYVRSVPTRLEREKIRHQAKKRPTAWHMFRSWKRRHQVNTVRNATASRKR
ncbi:hypothetical protein GN958_ATG03834 [Phytophthora infestans]|uniref:Uncharacterized protein n=1 Tax=Phytophthora infestans TaxID=4787 RepID=A0A8S9V4A3_PHYIN|nr:hypothetical protein GN958_ATG03834 [Phytophthora infestans]